MRHARLLVVALLGAAGCASVEGGDGAVHDDADRVCLTSPGMPGPGFEVQRQANGTYAATFTGHIIAADDARDQITVRSVQSAQAIGFGAYGHPLDLGGLKRGERVTVAFVASYSDGTRAPLSVVRAPSACPPGVAAYGFVVRKGLVGDWDLGFRGAIVAVEADRLIVEARADAAPNGRHRVEMVTRQGYALPSGLQVGQQVTAYVASENDQNVVYAIDDGSGALRKPAVPARPQPPGVLW